MAMAALAEDTIREDMQISMMAARAAVLEGDLQKFLSAIDPIQSKSKITEDQWTLLMANKSTIKLLLRGMPDLKNDTKFLDVKIREDWAAYYAESNLSDAKYQTLSVYLFHKSDKSWRPTGKKYGLTKADPNGEAAAQGYPAWTGKADMLSTIESDKNFFLETLTSLKPE